MLRKLLPLALTLGVLAACTGSVTPPTSEDGQSSSSAEPVAAELSDPAGVDMSRSSINFEGRSNIINHPGTFEEFSIVFTRDSTAPDDLTKASLAADIDITSVKTNSTGVDAHFQREDFFDTATYPMATFRSTKIESTGDNAYAITGDLTMKGITKSVTMDATLEDDMLIMHHDVSRHDFNIAKDSYKDKLLETMVPVDINVALAD